MLQELQDGKPIAARTTSGSSVLGLEVKEINNALKKKYNIEDNDGSLIIVSVDPIAKQQIKDLLREIL